MTRRREIQEKITAHFAAAVGSFIGKGLKDLEMIEVNLPGPPQVWNRVSLQSPIFGKIDFEIVTDLSGYDADYSGFSLEVRAQVEHRDTGELVPIQSRTPLKWEDFRCPDPYRCAELVRKCLIHLATHEIDEMLLVDGRRYRDPHQ